MAGFDVSGSGGGAGSGDTTPTIQALGNLGTTETIAMAGESWVWCTGTLDDNCAITVTGLSEGDRLTLFLAQDGTGGRTLSVNDGSGAVALSIPSTASATFKVELEYDGSDSFIDVAGGGSGDASIGGFYKHLTTASGRIDAGVSATSLLWHGGGQAATAAATAAAAGDAVLYINPADYTIGSLTNKYRIRASCLTNNVAPAQTLTVGLYPVTASAGASGTVSVTLDTVVAGSTIAFTTPAANTLSQNVTADFTAPAAGYYAIAVALTGATAASSNVAVGATLQFRQV